MFAAVRLYGKLIVPALHKSLSEIVRRHEVLRTTFRMINDRPVQVIAPDTGIQLSITDLSKLPVETQDREIEGLICVGIGKFF